jgi:hypothetical protein
MTASVSSTSTTAWPGGTAATISVSRNPDDDEAFWQRWLLVEFPNYYPPTGRDSKQELDPDDTQQERLI